MQCNETGKSQSYYYCQMTFLLIKKPWLNHSTKKMVSKRPNSLKKLNRRYGRFPKKAGQVEIGFQTVLFHKGVRVSVCFSSASTPQWKLFRHHQHTHSNTSRERERERETKNFQTSLAAEAFLFAKLISSILVFERKAIRTRNCKNLWSKDLLSKTLHTRGPDTMEDVRKSFIFATIGNYFGVDVDVAQLNNNEQLNRFSNWSKIWSKLQLKRAFSLQTIIKEKCSTLI